MDLWRALQDDKQDLEAFARRLPCILHINDAQDFHLTYIDPTWGAKLQVPDGQTFEQASTTLSFVHPQDLKSASQSVRYYVDHHQEFNTVSFLQRVRLAERGWVMLYTTSLLRPELGGLVSFSVELDSVFVQDRPVEALAEETQFIKDHLTQFASLTAKEQKFIALWVKNTDAETMAACLQLSRHTVKTYKKRIYAKLGINRFADLLAYARAFDIRA